MQIILNFNKKINFKIFRNGVKPRSQTFTIFQLLFYNPTTYFIYILNHIEHAFLKSTGRMLESATRVVVPA